jgi:predicted amidohydrolase YtcJ
MEHAQIIREEDIPRFKRYNVAASVQPVHILADRDTADRYWGKRARWAYPFKTMLEKGIKLGFGSDSPIEKPNPLLGIYSAVRRKRPDDLRDSWYVEECVTLKEAVNAYTTGAAEICSWSGKSGVIAPGARADFIVLSDDIYKVKIEHIPGLRILATIVDGNIAYRNKAFKL